MNDTIKRRARVAIRDAIGSGRLVRPGECEDCHSIPKPFSDGRAAIHAHHRSGYENPLDVSWLCPVCHYKLDRRPSGSRNGVAKLTEEQVAEIRRLYHDGNRYASHARVPQPYSQPGLAKRFGVSQCSISRIILRRGWVAEWQRGGGA